MRPELYSMEEIVFHAAAAEVIYATRFLVVYTSFMSPTNVGKKDN